MDENRQKIIASLEWAIDQIKKGKNTLYVANIVPESDVIPKTFLRMSIDVYEPDLPQK